MGQNGPQVFVQSFILADYAIINEFISIQCFGPFYSYDASTLNGLLGYRSYIVVSPHLILVAPFFCKIFPAFGSIWKFSDISRK